MLKQFLKILVGISDREEVPPPELPIVEPYSPSENSAQLEAAPVPDKATTETVSDASETEALKEQIKILEERVKSLLSRLRELDDYTRRCQTCMMEYRKANEGAWAENQEIKRKIRVAVWELKEWLKST